MRGDPELSAAVLNELAEMDARLHVGETAGELRHAALDALERAIRPQGVQDVRAASALLDWAQDVAYANQRAGSGCAGERRGILDALGDESSDARFTGATAPTAAPAASSAPR